MKYFTHAIDAIQYSVELNTTVGCRDSKANRDFLKANCTFWQCYDHTGYTILEYWRDSGDEYDDQPDWRVQIREEIR